MRLEPVLRVSLCACLLCGCSRAPTLPTPKGAFLPVNPSLPSYGMLTETPAPVRTLSVVSSPPARLPVSQNAASSPLPAVKLAATGNTVADKRPAAKTPAKPPVLPMSGTSPIKPLKEPGSPVVVPPLAGASMGKNPFSGGAVARQGPTPVKPLLPPRLWTITPGTTLKQAFMRWAAGETCQSSRHWTVRWPVQTDYPVDSPLTFTGSFEAVTQQLFSLYRDAHTPLYVDGYRAQCLMVVSDKK